MVRLLLRAIGMRPWPLVLAPLFLLACGAESADGAMKEDDFESERSESSPGGPGASGDPSGDEPGLPACAPSPACDGASGPSLGATRSWKNLTTHLVVAAGDANHRGRDQIVAVGDPQWIIGKFAYGLIDKDLKGEEVDVYVERGCAGQWEKLGTATTTAEGAHPSVEGVEDNGGRVYFRIPDDKLLAPGRHRVRLVVAGDHSFADLTMDIVPKGSPVFVSDVDGTLTESENAEYPALLTGSLPNAHPNAPEALAELVKKGYRPVYLTARPEWLTNRTREFLAARGFPPGTIHTTTGLTGALGSAATTFKAGELALLAQKGLEIAWAFGNKDSDAAAYEAAKIDPKDHRVFLRMSDPNGGRRIEAYSELLPVLQAEAPVCQ